jgi:hypothetical protein
VVIGGYNMTAQVTKHIENMNGQIITSLIGTLPIAMHINNCRPKGGVAVPIRIVIMMIKAK